MSNMTTDSMFTTLRSWLDRKLGLKEALANKVTLLSQSNTDTQYPSAKCVYDAIQNGKAFIVTNSGGLEFDKTFAEILAAHNSGRYVYLVSRDMVLPLSNIESSFAVFTSLPSNKTVYTYGVTSDNVWSSNNYAVEDNGNKTTSLSASSTNTQYPSAKAVYDALQNVEIDVDSSLSSSSENPVQNKVINAALSGKESTSNKVTLLTESNTDEQYPSAKCVYDALQNVEIDVDNALSATSENPVQNKVIYNALQNVSIAVDNELSSTSENPVQNKVVKAALDAKQSTLTAGNGIDITNNVISVVQSSAEIVRITVTSTVEGTSVEGLQILAYYNGATQPTVTLTTDAYGMASVSVPNGYSYRLAFPSIEGCADVGDITHTATLTERSIEVEYNAPVIEGETVRIEARTYTPSSSAYASNVAVTVSWPANSSAGISAGSVSLTTDTRGQAETIVPIGATYTITMGAADGYTTPTAKTYTANQSIRVVAFFYRVFTTGLLLVTSDGSEMELSAFQEAVEGGTYTNDDAIAIKVSTEALATAGGVFLIDIDMLANGTNMPSSKQWSPNTSYTFTSIPTNGNSASARYYYDGMTASQLIQSEGDEHSVSTPAVDAALALSLSINGDTKPGFLGSVGQWAALWPNAFQVDDILAAVRPDSTGRLSSRTGQKWTSTQYSSLYAWYWTTGASYGLKNYSCAVVPFFAY